MSSCDSQMANESNEPNKYRQQSTRPNSKWLTWVDSIAAMAAADAYALIIIAFGVRSQLHYRTVFLLWATHQIAVSELFEIQWNYFSIFIISMCTAPTMNAISLCGVINITSMSNCFSVLAALSQSLVCRAHVKSTNAFHFSIELTKKKTKTKKVSCDLNLNWIIGFRNHH